MEKLKDLSRKSYLEAWNSSKVIEFVVIYTSDGFSYMKFNETLVILKPKKSLFFVCLTNKMTTSHLKMMYDDQLSSALTQEGKTY